MAKTAPPRLVRIRVAGHSAAIVLIHGFRGRADKTWGKLPELLAEANDLADWDVVSLGYRTNLVASLLARANPLDYLKRRFWSRLPPIQHLADGLATRFAHSDPLRSYEDVVLAAHSMGGLVVQRALVDSERLRNKVRQVVVFGTPSGGLEVTRFKWVNDQVRDMEQAGPFIRRLREDWEALRPLPFQFLAVKGAEDFFVPPESSQGPFPLLDGLEFPPEERATVAGDHLGMVKPLNAEDEAPQLLIGRITRRAIRLGVSSPAWVARGEGEARETIRTYGGHPEALDKQSRISLALAYDFLGRPDQAMEVLRLVTEDDADGMGTMGGRFKRAWQEGRRQADADEAITWYGRGLETAVGNDQPHLAYYNGINLAYMRLAAEDDPAEARVIASEVLEWIARSTRPDPPWKEATAGEALAYLGRYDEALARYENALASDPRPPAWAIASMYRQAKSVGHYLRATAFSKGIEALFRSRGS